MQTDPLASSDSPPTSRAWVAATLLRRPQLLTRFHSAYERLRALPRGARRRIQRRAAVSLAGAALLLAMSSSPLLVPRAHAASINVGGTCSLADAIRSANSDSSVGTCAAGSGADDILLTGNVTLNTPAGYYFGSNTGLPLISSEITIHGNNFTIRRAAAAPDFRLMAVDGIGDLTLRSVTLSGGRSEFEGGAIYVYEGELNMIYTTLTGNYAEDDGGALYVFYGSVEIERSTVTNNTTGYAGDGGGIYLDGSTAFIARTTISNNVAGEDSDGHGGGVGTYNSDTSIYTSTISGNSAGHLGGGVASGSLDGSLYIVNSTISHNTADDSGGIYSSDDEVDIIHTTVTANQAAVYSGGIEIIGAGDATIEHSIISGNSVTNNGAHEIYTYGSTVTSQYNVLGQSNLLNADAFDGFTPDASDVTAASDGTTPTALGDILDTTLAGHGGPTLTHALVSGSPAIDLAPIGPGVDQREFGRPIGAAYDAGSFEYGSAVYLNDIYVSTKTAGVTDDNLAFGPHDIIKWDGSAWSKRFDGSAAGLTPNGRNKHDLSAIWIPDTAGADVVLGFVQNARKVPGISSKVDGMDLVWWDGSAFSLWFDGQDVGLTNLTNEKIDALHVLDGSYSPVGGSCVNYLLISTQAAGSVPGVGGAIKFGGEDVLGFCQTNVGPNTAGFWHKLIDGSDEGMQTNSTNGLTFRFDGLEMYLTTHKNFAVDAATGNHSMLYRYNFFSYAFSGPYFIAADAGLHEKVNGLHIDLPIP